MRYHFTPIKMAYNQKTNTRCGESGTLIRDCNMVHPLWKLLKMLNIELPHDRAIPFLDIYPREMKAHVHTNPEIFTELFIRPKK